MQSAHRGRPTAPDGPTARAQALAARRQPYSPKATPMLAIDCGRARDTNPSFETRRPRAIVALEAALVSHGSSNLFKPDPMTRDTLGKAPCLDGICAATTFPLERHFLPQDTPPGSPCTLPGKGHSSVILLGFRPCNDRMFVTRAVSELWHQNLAAGPSRLGVAAMMPLASGCKVSLGAREELTRHRAERALPGHTSVATLPTPILRVFKVPTTAILGLALVLLVGNQASATTWHVSKDAGASITQVQRAIELAASDDTILVAPGTYYEDIDFLGKGLVVRSQDGPEATTIDATGQDSSAVIFKNREPPTTVLEGFTITGGRGSSDDLSVTNSYGGGIIVLAGSPTIRNNIITGNSAGWGGGIHIGRLGTDVSAGNVALTNNIIKNNTATRNGGGVRIISSTCVLMSNSIESNSAASDGGGIDVRLDLGHVTIDHCTVTGNVAGDHGGGLQFYCGFLISYSYATVTSNLIVHNQALGSEQGDTGSGGGISANKMAGELRYNTIAYNEALGESPCAGGGVNFYGIDGPLNVDHNIIANNAGCGISCRPRVFATFGQNLLWANGIEDIGTTPQPCPSSWSSASVVADPEFCAPEVDDFRVAATSPALGANGPFGAIPAAGCPGVPVVPTTWSAIKALRWR